MLISDAADSALSRLYDKLVLDEHYANLYGPAAAAETEKAGLSDTSLGQVGAGDTAGRVEQGVAVLRGVCEHMADECLRGLVVRLFEFLGLPWKLVVEIQAILNMKLVVSTLSFRTEAVKTKTI